MSEDLLVPRDYPPLPPGCWYAREKLASGAYGWAYPNSEGFRLEENVPRNRHLLACFMRCAWLDEAARIRLSITQLDVRVPDPNELEALRNSVAWKMWGQVTLLSARA